MMTPRIAVVSLWAEDVPTTVHFYHDVLGFSLLPHHHERPHFNVGNGYLTILKGRPIPAHNAEPSHFPLVAFVVENFEATIERDDLIGHRLKAVAASLCDGLMTPLLMHLVDPQRLSERELRSVRSLLDEFERSPKRRQKQ